MSLPGLFFGGNKGSDKFQPLNLGFSHEKRSIFDSGALVRARVRCALRVKAETVQPLLLQPSVQP